MSDKQTPYLARPTFSARAKPSVRFLGAAPSHTPEAPASGVVHKETPRTLSFQGQRGGMGDQERSWEGAIVRPSAGKRRCPVTQPGGGVLGAGQNSRGPSRPSVPGPGASQPRGASSQDLALESLPPLRTWFFVCPFGFCFNKVTGRSFL